MNSKEYKLPNGKKAVFEYDITGVGKITLECMDELMGMIADRPQGEWIEQEDDYHHYWECSECGMGVGLDDIRNYCPHCGAQMKGADDE